MPSIDTELGERAMLKMQHEMDWKPLKERCLRVFPSWSVRHLDNILREYQRFLALKVATRDIYDTIVLAPTLLDAMWKQHILSTQQYYADCQLLLQTNQILHYNADASLTVSDGDRNKRMELTKASLCMMFSDMYPLSRAAKGVWDYEHVVDSESNHSHLNHNSGENGGAIPQPLLADDHYPDGHDEDITNGLLTEEEDEEEEESTRIEEETEQEPSNSDNSFHRKRQPIKIPNREPRRKPSRTEHRNDRIAHRRTREEDADRRLIYIYCAGKVSKLLAFPHDTVMEIKTKIQKKTGLAPHQQHLEWEGQKLEEERSINHYGIPAAATIVMTKIRNPAEREKSIQMNKIKQHGNVNDEQLEGANMNVRSSRQLVEQRDDPEVQPNQHDRTASTSTSPTRHRPRPPSSPREYTPKPPRPPLPHQQTQPQHQHQNQHTPYSPSTQPEDDSFVTEPSTVAHDQRQQQALRNKLRMQSHNDRRHPAAVEDSSTYQSTIPSRPSPKPPKPLKVFVNTIMGFTITLKAKASDSVEQLKQMIDDLEDIPTRKQILVLDGLPLDDSQLLSDYTSESSLHVLLRLQAGSSSVGSIGVSSSLTASPGSTMATVSREKFAASLRIPPLPPPINKLLVRSPGRLDLPHTSPSSSPRHQHSPIALENRPQWR